MADQRLLLALDQFEATKIRLTPSQQHYLLRVLRLGPGDHFIALNGQGQQWKVALTDDPSRAEIVSPLESQESVNQPEIALAAAIPKGSGFDEVIRQSTELGVSQIWPILSDRTLSRPSPNKLERWRRIAAEATEQSERLTVPAIAEPIAWADCLNAPWEGQRYLCVARGDAPHLLTRLHADHPTAVLLATGPEGGWTEAEIEQALAHQFQSVSLGSFILRAVTAPLLAIGLTRAVWATQV